MKAAPTVAVVVLWASVTAAGAIYVHHQNVNSCRHRHGVEVCYDRRWRKWSNEEVQPIVTDRHPVSR